MNPTDQARKEARRKELKKNKKQRLQVRQAVIKQKDPKLIFSEMEAIDKMEYDPNNPPPYNVKVLQDKRRKLKDSWLKMYHFYQREDPKQASELKFMELDYERRRSSLMAIHESIMQAQRVKLDDIPLPDINMPPPPPPPEIEPTISNEPSTDAPKSILKTPKVVQQPPKLVSSCYDSSKKPPGPPTSSPPSLAEFECDNDEFELGLSLDESYKSQEKPKKIRFDPSQETAPNSSRQAAASAPLPPPPPPVTVATIQQSLKSYMNKPNPLQAQIAAYQSKNVQQQMQNRVPPPQSYSQPQQPLPPRSNQTQAAAEPPQATTIQAKPVLRNKMAEITKFVPTSLVVKRDTKKPAGNFSSSLQSSSLSHTAPNQSGGPFNYMLQQQQQYATLNPLNSYKSALSSSTSLVPSKVQANFTSSQPISIVAAPSVQRIDPTDDTYDDFMKEIGKLL